MFHTYVLTGIRTSDGVKVVDFERARLLMDRELLRGAIKAMNKAMAAGIDEWDKFCAERNGMTFDPFGPQWIWDYYCARHYEKYGTPFQPDVDPDWDR